MYNYTRFVFLLCKLDNSRNKDTGKEINKEVKQSSTIGCKDFFVNIQ